MENKWKKTNELNTKIFKKKLYLQDTLYVVLDIAEAFANGDENKIEALKQRYKAELAQRAVVRDEIDNLEKELASIM